MTGATGTLLLHTLEELRSLALHCFRRPSESEATFVHRMGKIRCPDAEPVAQYFQMQIRLIDPQDRLDVELAVKRWSINGDLGVEFIKMKPEDQARLRTPIRHCEEAGVLIDR